MLLLPPARRLLALAGLTLALALPLAVSFGGRLDDIELYSGWVVQVAQGALPYRDFALEYPPLATLSILLAGLVSASWQGFAAAFVVSMGLWDAFGKWHMAQSLPAGRRLRFWLLVTSLSVVLNYILLRRFDPVAACCTAMALSGLCTKPKSWAPFVWLGLGVAVKLYPIILAPGMLVFAWHHHRRFGRSIQQLGLMLGVLCLPSVAAYAWVGPQSLYWLHFNQARGLHVASSLVSWAIVWRGGLGHAIAVELAYGCTQVVSAWSMALAKVSPLLSLAALSLTFGAMCNRLQTPEGLWRLSTALICALLLTAKVFSPQYMVWLVGVGAMSCAQSRRVPWGLVLPLALSSFATAQLFPNEARIFRGCEAAQLWLIARSLALIWLWAALTRPWASLYAAWTTRRVIDKRQSKRHIPNSTQ